MKEEISFKKLDLLSELLINEDELTIEFNYKIQDSSVLESNENKCFNCLNAFNCDCNKHQEPILKCKITNKHVKCKAICIKHTNL